MAAFNTGDIITFKYSKISTHDKAPLLLVIAPLWKNKIHGINIHYLTSQKRELVYAMLNTSFREHSEVLRGYTTFAQLLRSGTLEAALKIPDTFYERFIKAIVRSNAYRTFEPRFISQTRRLDINNEQTKNLILQ